MIASWKNQQAAAAAAADPISCAEQEARGAGAPGVTAGGRGGRPSPGSARAHGAARPGAPCPERSSPSSGCSRPSCSGPRRAPLPRAFRCRAEWGQQPAGPRAARAEWQLCSRPPEQRGLSAGTTQAGSETAPGGARAPGTGEAGSRGDGSEVRPERPRPPLRGWEHPGRNPPHVRALLRLAPGLPARPAAGHEPGTARTHIDTRTQAHRRAHTHIDTKAHRERQHTGTHAHTGTPRYTQAHKHVYRHRHTQRDNTGTHMHTHAQTHRGSRGHTHIDTKAHTGTHRYRHT